MRLQEEIGALGLSAAPNPDLPFQGGALGLFGYDLGRRFETLPGRALADISLPDMAVGLYDWALIVDHRKQTVSLLCHGDVQGRLAWLEAQRPAPVEPFTLASGWRSNMTAADYAEKFSRVQAYLQSGDCYQVNLAQRFQAAYRGTSGRRSPALMPAIRPRSARFYALNAARSSACRPSALFIWRKV